MTEIAAITAARVPASPQDRALRAAAEELEAQFLAEMLKSAGLGAARESFGGGIGEEQFASYLRLEQAAELARHGGAGLAESIFEALKRRAGDAA